MISQRQKSSLTQINTENNFQTHGMNNTTIPLALATDFNGQHTTVAEMDNCLKAIRTAGFTHTHWCHDWDSSYIYAPSEIRQIASMHQHYNLQTQGLHASTGGGWRKVHGVYRNRCGWDDRKDYTSENEYAREAGVHLIKNRIDLAAALDAKVIVLHMQLPWEPMQKDPEFQSRYFQQVFKSFDELKPYCLDKGIRIAVENLPGEPNGLSKDRFDALFDRYPEECMGFCFDSGHALIMAKPDPLELLERYKNRLIAMHLHDNKGCTAEEWHSDPMTSACDLHMIPMTGTLDWDRLAKLVAKSAYTLPLCLEPGYVSSNETVESWLNRTREAGLQLHGMVLQVRNEQQSL